jgi:alkylation response protein AidB-like acyl-CoA dehydrogenase
MYNLHLTPEQLEFRDTVRAFVEGDVKPIALHPDRLQPFDKPLLAQLLDKASQMGLRTMALSEEAGGAGADCLTSCIVMEELAAGDVDLAATLAQTSALARTLFGGLVTPAQNVRFLKAFVEDDQYHLALAARDPEADIGWSYHRPLAAESGDEPAAVKQANGEWLINGTVPFVANAPVAKLFAVQVRSGQGKSGLSTLLVPRNASGLTVHPQVGAFSGPAGNGGSMTRWFHGTGSGITLKDCRVAADHLLGKEGASPFTGSASTARSVPLMAAVNLGVGRAAYEAAVTYAKLRRQGGRNIVEHQAIGTKLADCAIKLELARTMIWKAAWALDHPEVVADRSASDLPLHTIARVYTAEAMNDVTLLSAECFGAMGVMRDMPLQKYVHDGMIFLHSDETDGAAKLKIAEALAGYERPLAA